LKFTLFSGFHKKNKVNFNFFEESRVTYQSTRPAVLITIR